MGQNATKPASKASSKGKPKKAFNQKLIEILSDWSKNC
jgi:hypothetical protein